MSIHLSGAEDIMQQAVGHVFPTAQVQVRAAGKTVLDAAYGWLDPETRRQPAGLDTQFDLASVTKLFVVTAFMTLVEQGVVSLDQPVNVVLPAFSGLRPIRPYEDPLRTGVWIEVTAGTNGPAAVDAGRTTFRELLVHNSGLPAWRPLWRMPSAEAGRALALQTAFAYAPGARVIYSDIGLILLGLAIECLTGKRLDAVITERVLAPLGLQNTGYRPLSAALTAPADGVTEAQDVAPTEFCAWRRRRLQGEVHDENAARLGGVAGHAGLFGTAADLAAFGQMYLDGGAPVLNPATVAAMTRIQAQDGTVRRGLGFALWSPDPEASGHPFSEAAFGHTGFTGPSLWVDPRRSLVVALLTNRVYYGRDPADITAFRVAFHRALVDALDEPAETGR